MKVARDDIERVDWWVDSLRTRRFLSAEKLRSLKGSQIKSFLEELHVSTDILTLREKDELVAALLARRDSACAICMQEFQEHDAYKQTRCGHGFHDACLREWAIKTPTCPTCCTAIKAPPPSTPPRNKVSQPVDDMMKDIFTSLQSTRDAMGTMLPPWKRMGT